MDLTLSVAIIACLFFINTLFITVALWRLARMLNEAHKFVEMARLQLAPLAHDATQIVSDIRVMVKTAEKEMDKVGDSLTAVRDTARNLQQFEATIQDRIERPLLDMTSVLSGLVKGTRVFWQHFAKR